MRHTVWADECVTTPDGAGGQVTTWVPRFGFKASVEPISGREQMHANQLIADMDTRITLRWSVAAAQINATWRLRSGGVIYDIKAPPIDKSLARREIEILVRAGLVSYADEVDPDVPFLLVDEDGVALVDDDGNALIFE